MKTPINALLACAIAFVMFAGQQALAQQNFNCCTWSVQATGVPDACCPFTVTARWFGGFSQFSVPEGNLYTGLPFITSSPCPPSPPIFGASLDGGLTYATPGNPVTYTVNGCCLIASVGFDFNGCVLVTITYC